ncbi:MAG: zinc ribbon domain-containing protein [Verrucomicrobiaceae bacterium]
MTDHDIASALAASGLTPAPHSPLHGLGAAPKKGGGFPKKPSAASQRALSILAQPRWELGIIHDQPWGDEPRWFYAAEGDAEMTVEWEKNDGVARELKLVPWSDHAHFLSQCLALDAPTPDGMLRLRTTPGGLAALLAVIDAVRRAALCSLLEHLLPPPEIEFKLADVGRRFAETLAREDLRWLSAMVARLCTITLPTDPATFFKGMNELVEARLLLPAGKETWKPTQGLLILAHALAAPLACAGISRTDLLSPAAGTQHLVVLRGAGTLWLIEFPDDDTVLLRDASHLDVELALALRLQPGTAGQHKDAPAAQSSKPAPVKPSPVKVIDRRGSRDHKEEPPPAKSSSKAASSPPPLPAPATCPQCGGPLRPQAKFCTLCGKSLK